MKAILRGRERQTIVMTAKLILRDKEYIVKSGTTVRHAIEKIGVNSETVLATRAGELITDDEIVLEDDVIKLVAVISGGRTTEDVDG